MHGKEPADDGGRHRIAQACDPTRQRDFNGVGWSENKARTEAETGLDMTSEQYKTIVTAIKEYRAMNRRFAKLRCVGIDDIIQYLETRSEPLATLFDENKHKIIFLGISFRRGNFKKLERVLKWTSRDARKESLMTETC